MGYGEHCSRQNWIPPGTPWTTYNRGKIEMFFTAVTKPEICTSKKHCSVFYPPWKDLLIFTLTVKRHDLGVLQISPLGRYSFRKQGYHPLMHSKACEMRITCFKVCGALSVSSTFCLTCKIRLLACEDIILRRSHAFLTKQVTQTARPIDEHWKDLVNTAMHALTNQGLIVSCSTKGPLAHFCI